MSVNIKVNVKAKLPDQGNQPEVKGCTPRFVSILTYNYANTLTYTIPYSAMFDGKIMIDLALTI